MALFPQLFHPSTRTAPVLQRVFATNNTERFIESQKIVSQRPLSLSKGVQMIRHANRLITSIILFSSFALANVSAQTDSGMYRYLFTLPETETQTQGKYPAELFVTDMSGDGRFVVIESNRNIATVNPRNEDGNREIFLFDLAQRHIFQITDTKSSLLNPSGSSNSFSNISVLIDNHRPSISNNGSWIAFSSNATTSTPSSPDATNPGNFDGNVPGRQQILQEDGNMEVWLYRIPTYSTVDLSSGTTPAFVDLSNGTFFLVTNTPTSRYPQPGTGPTSNPPNRPPFVADDNGRSSLDDTGSTLAFSSTRDLVPGGNSFPSEDNEEIFVYKRINDSFGQITRTPRGPIFSPIYNNNPSISGDGLRVTFNSTGTNPVIGMTGGCNPEFNDEIHFTDLTSSGNPAGVRKQITITAPTTFDPVNSMPPVYRSISRNGRYVTFVSSATLDVNSGNCITGGTPIGSGYALFLYDSDNPTTPFKRIGPYDDSDSQLVGGDGLKYGRFTDYDAQRNPASLIFTSRINMCPDGSMPPVGCSVGLNPSPSRPSQVYIVPISTSSQEFTKISNSTLLAADVTGGLCVAGNTRTRSNCGFAGADFGRSIDQILLPPLIEEDEVALTSFVTGAGGIPLNSIPGLNSNMLAGGLYTSQLAPVNQAFSSPVTLERALPTPLQLNGVSVTVDRVLAGITQVFSGQVNFIVPKGLSPGIKEVIINNNGIVIRSSLQIVESSQPDVITRYFDEPSTYDIKSHGRAKVLNITNPNNPHFEPFRVVTETPSGPQPTKLRLFLTGVEDVLSSSVTIKIGSVTISQSNILTNAVATDYPGVFTFDFDLPSSLDGAGNVPVEVTVGGAGSRPAITAARVNIIGTQSSPDDLGIWRPKNGEWWVMSGQGTQYSVAVWGMLSDKTAPGDFDGDGKTDFSIFRPSTGQWWIVNSGNGSTMVSNWGTSGDIPVPADYDGDGKTDFAVFRPSNSTWYIVRSSDQTFTYQQFGLATDVPSPADYDGDGLADISVWRNNNTTFYTINSGSGTFQTIFFTQSGPRPVSADYDGDGKADYATTGGGDNTWRILNSTTGQITSIQWGNFATDIAVQGDYDSDNKADVAVWSSSGPNVGLWNILKSSNGQVRAQFWGTTGDIPVPARW